MRILFFIMMSSVLTLFSQVKDAVSYLSNDNLNTIESNYAVFYNPTLVPDSINYTLVGTFLNYHQAIDILDVGVGGAMKFNKQILGFRLLQESLYGYANQEITCFISQSLHKNTRLALSLGAHLNNLHQERTYNGLYQLYATHKFRKLQLSGSLRASVDNSKLEQNTDTYLYTGEFGFAYYASENLSIASNLSFSENKHFSLGLHYKITSTTYLSVSFSPKPVSFGLVGHIRLKDLNIGLGFNYKHFLGVSSGLMVGYEQ